MKAFGYIRVSTDHQADNGTSLDAQKKRVLEAIAAKGWEPELVVDTVSGKSLRRPGLQTALARLSEGEAGAVVVSRLDRLSRSVGDFADLLARAEREGWAIICLDPAVDMTTPYGRAMAGVAAVFAQLERELISQRQRESIAQRRAAGVYRPGRAPVGGLALERIRALRAQEMSAERICAQLELEGIKPPAGKRWHPRTVRRVIERECVAAAPEV